MKLTRRPFLMTPAAVGAAIAVPNIARLDAFDGERGQNFIGTLPVSKSARA